MAIVPIRVQGDVERKYMAVAVDVAAEGALTPDYVVVGYKITSSAMETNPDSETITDIRGITYETLNKMEPSMTFEPHRINKDEGGALGAKLIQLFRDRNYSAFGQFKCVHIWGMLDSTEAGVYVADRYDACTIIPNSFGGESWFEVPFTVTFGGNITKGTADKLIGHVTFTEE